MTVRLFQNDAYLQQCEAKVLACRDGRLELDQTVFYPTGGGQPGDSGVFVGQDGREIAIANTVHGSDGGVDHILEDPETRLEPGTQGLLKLNWERRYRHMRMHTCLHLLGAVIPYGVTGGNISESRSRLDFDMQDTVDKQEATDALNALIQSNKELRTHYISGPELAKKPELVRTLSVKPPMNAPEIRLLEIPGIDLQPCGGTHLRSTGEIGKAVVSKVEKKGKHNRRVYVELQDTFAS